MVRLSRPVPRRSDRLGAGTGFTANEAKFGVMKVPVPSVAADPSVRKKPVEIVAAVAVATWKVTVPRKMFVLVT